MKAQLRNKSVDASLYILNCDGRSLCGGNVIEALDLLESVNFADSAASIAELKI